MLTTITDKRANSECQALLKNKLSESLKSSLFTTIGFPGGSWQTEVIYNSKIWYNSYDIDEEGKSKRYWNGFGLSNGIKSNKSLNIAVEINVPFSGVDRKVSGFFARDENSGEVFLMHRGKVGGGRKGIGKSAFINWAEIELIEIKEGKKTSSAIKVANLDGKNVAREIAAFVTKASNFKEYITAGAVNVVEMLSLEELYARAKESAGKKLEVSSKSIYVRDGHIAEIAKRKAKGKCQLCLQKAPFEDKFGKPYLETHHIDWLSSGGADTIENTVAICPNCHRKMHSLALSEDVEILRERAKV
ncbi:MAG: HNH endonuclease [Saccharospirillum sp.]|nr:HNH endonuclease [Saccharospirillum sp.]